MDCFSSPCYEQNRKLLLLVGQWPYQSFADRSKRWILYFCVLVTAYVPQVAKIVTTEISFDVFMEIISDQLTVTLAAIRYFIYTTNNNKAKDLLDDMKLNWQSLMDNNEHNIFGESAEDGRLYTLRYFTFIHAVLTIAWITIFSPPILKYMNLINNSHVRIIYYPAEYFIDEEKYYYVIIAHMNLVVWVVVFTAVVTETFYVILMYHIIGMFKVACYRLEHAFDNCNDQIKHASGRTNVCEKTAIAVEYYKRAVRFCDTTVTMFEYQNLISLMLVLLNITVSLYWAIKSKEQGIKLIFGLTFTAALMLHMLMLEFPAQKITDNSGEVRHKAYSSMWYLAPVKEQTLVLLTMQRGLRPNAMVMGKVHTVSLENFASEVKASFSYFTVLMSLK